MTKQLQSVQALRGVACLIVVLFHVDGIDHYYFSWVPVHPLRPMSVFGFAGVDLFFVLSGFIITTTSRAHLGRPAFVFPFLFRRAWRIFPPFWVALGLSLGLTYVINRNFYRTATGRVWLPARPLVPFDGAVELLPVAWTLSYELMFYLVFSLLFLLPRRIGPWILVGWAAWIIGRRLTIPGLPENLFFRHAVNPYILEFLMGCAVAWMPVWPRGYAAGAVAVGAVLWAGLGLVLAPDLTQSGLIVDSTRRAGIFGVGSALLLLAAAGYERSGGRTRYFGLVSLGNASYSIYLIHWPVILALYILTLRLGWSHSPVWHLYWLALLTVLPIGLGLLFHRWVERPLLALAKPKKRATPDRVPGLIIPIPLTVRRG